jgi:cytochrome b involved in lipid metabolism
MKFILGAAVLLLMLSGCASQQSLEAPVAQPSQESASAEPSPTESAKTEEPAAEETTEPEPEQTSEPEATAEPTTTATTQTQQSAAASPSPTATATAKPTPSPTQTETVVAGYTMADVRMNNTASSCWVAIDGRVYDLTRWIAGHPGGPDAITQLCGTDGTVTFTARHGGQPSPSATLNSYDIGPLS